MSETNKERKIVKEEVRFAWHLPKNKFREDDYHYVKYAITYDDGKTEPQIRLIKNFKRPIFITKQEFRNHKEKKEFEDREKLLLLQCTESDKNLIVAQSLGKPHLANNVDEIKNNPFIYAYDITSTSLIKYTTLRKNNFVQTPYSVAAFDIETNPNTNEIIIASIAFKDKIYVCVLEKFIKNVGALDIRLKNSFNNLLPNHSHYSIEYTICNHELDIIEKIFEKANEWGPDFLAIWNMNFDIPFILNRIKYYNKYPTDYLCDKSIPREFRICKYKQGITKKVTASGVVKPINPSLQWHTLILTAKFYVIDSMCVYRQLRMAKQEEPSYSLDAILKKELNSSKLKFKEAENYNGLAWHLFMQENYPVEYIVYNMYDVISMLDLDNKIKDLTTTLPSFAGITDFNKFNSNPKKIVDALFLFGLEKNKIIGTVGKINKEEEEIIDPDLDIILEEEIDEDYDISKYKTLSLKNWIQLLPQDHLLHNGLKIFNDYKNVTTFIRGVVVDLDCISSYPSCTLVGNVSKETTVTEVIDIENVKEEIFREENLSIPMGATNMLEYFNVMFNLPSLLEIHNILEEEA